MLNTEFIFSNMFEHRHYHCIRTYYTIQILPNYVGIFSFPPAMKTKKKSQRMLCIKKFQTIPKPLHSADWRLQWHVDSADDETLGTLHIPNNPDWMLDNSNVLSYLVDLLFHQSVRKICTRLHLFHIRWCISCKLYYDHNPHSLFCSLFIILREEREKILAE